VAVECNILLITYSIKKKEEFWVVEPSYTSGKMLGPPLTPSHGVMASPLATIISLPLT
jgi:hypothetical protein